MENPVIGTWSYRSFINNPDLSVDFNALRFGAGTLEIEEQVSGQITGSLGGAGWSLDIQGWSTLGNPFTLRFQGKGELGGEPWVYDYHGFYCPMWPNGINQRPTLVGTIVRTVPHSNGQADAGVVASWIAVRQ